MVYASTNLIVMKVPIMSNIENPYYWLEKMIEARITGQLHRAIYWTSNANWDVIQKSHRNYFYQLLTAEHKVLDVGCGYGALIECIPSEVDYTGIDLNPYLVAWGSRRYETNRLFVGDGKNLSQFQDKTFDYTISRSVVGGLSEDCGFEYVDLLKEEMKRVSHKTIYLGFTHPDVVEVEDYS